MSESVKNTETQNQLQPQKKNVGMKILNTIINIMIVLVLIVSVFIAAMAISSKANNGISTIFGYTIQPIQSDSMKGGSPDGYPGGDFGKGDLMIAKATDFSSNAVYELGDIVTFRTKDTDGSNMLIAHRIVDVIKDENGTYTYQTQGDNRETSPDPDQFEPKRYLTAGNIGSVYYSESYQGKILKGWGAPLDFLQTQLGFFLVVLLPMIIFFMYELIRVVLNFSNYKKAKADEEKDEAVRAAVADALAGKQVDENEAAFEKMTPEQIEQFKAFLAMQNTQQAESETAEASDEAETAEGFAPAEEPAETKEETTED